VDGTDCSKFIVHSGMDWNIEEVRWSQYNIDFNLFLFL
jgi:hypothetical protein